MPLDPNHIREEDLAPGVRAEIERIAQREADGKLRAYVRRAVVGFLILLAGVGYADLAQYNNRHDLATQARVVVREGCLRDWHSAVVLRTIVIRSQTSLRQLHAAGSLDDALYNTAVRQNTRALNDLKLPDCDSAADQIPIK